MRLAEILKEKNISDAELAKRIGCRQSNVCQWRRGRYKPGIDYLEKIANALDCSLYDLLGIPDKRQARLTRNQSKAIYKAVSNDGELTADDWHEWASALQRKAGGKITSMVVLFRSIAEALYKLELVSPQEEKPSKAIKSNTQQLRLPV